jgi:hypothetical protein
MAPAVIAIKVQKYIKEISFINLELGLHSHKKQSSPTTRLWRYRGRGIIAPTHL